MNSLRKLLYWVPPVVLAGIFLGGLFWEEKLKVNLVNHKLIAIAFLLIFFYSLNRWIDLSERDYLTFKYLEKNGKQYQEIRFTDVDGNLENKK